MGDYVKWARWKPQKNLRQQVLHYEIYRLTVREWLTFSGMGIGFSGAAAYVFYRSIPVFFIFMPIALFCPLLMKKTLKEKRLKELNSQFKEAILVLSSFLSAGYSVENAFEASTRELTLLYGSEGMMTMEFSRMESLIRMNRPAEQVIMEFADRSGLDDVRNFAEVFAAAKRSGGELVAIIAHTAGVIGDKIQVREEIDTLTSSRRFEQKIMNLLPFLIVLYVDGTSPGFFDAMYHTAMGRVVMTGCLAVYGISCVLADHILKIEV